MAGPVAAQRACTVARSGAAPQMEGLSDIDARDFGTTDPGSFFCARPACHPAETAGRFGGFEVTFGGAQQHPAYLPRLSLAAGSQPGARRDGVISASPQLSSVSTTPLDRVPLRLGSECEPVRHAAEVWLGGAPWREGAAHGLSSSRWTCTTETGLCCGGFELLRADGSRIRHAADVEQLGGLVMRPMVDIEQCRSVLFELRRGFLLRELRNVHL